MPLSNGLLLWTTRPRPKQVAALRHNKWPRCTVTDGLLVPKYAVYLHDALLKTSIQEITKSSLSTGILEMAQQQAKTMLTSVLGMIIEQEVVVVFEEEEVEKEGE